MKFRTVIGAVAATAAFTLPANASSPAPAPSPAEETVFRVYLSPTGDDARTGLSQTDAVKTLDRAEVIIGEAIAANALDSDVEVRIEPGTYQDYKSTYWTRMVPGHKITFLPTTDDGGTTAPAGQLPVFVGRTDGTSEAKAEAVYWFMAAPTVATGPGEGLHFRHLKIQNYSNGIAFQGGTTVVAEMRRPDSTPFNNNSVYGMTFYRLGDRWNWNGAAASDYDSSSSLLVGNYGVALSNSSNNTFRNNHFRSLEAVDNPALAGDELDALHAFYVKDGAHHNQIRDNDFTVVSGSVIKARNDTHSNIITGNIFDHAGAPTDGVYYDRIENYPCSKLTPSACDPVRPATGWECPSHGNELTYNKVSTRIVDGVQRWTGYGNQVIPLFMRSPYRTASTGEPGCSNVVDGVAQPWLRTNGNTAL